MKNLLNKTVMILEGVKVERRGRVYLSDRMRFFVTPTKGSNFFPVPFFPTTIPGRPLLAKDWDAIGIFELPAVFGNIKKRVREWDPYPLLYECKLDKGGRLKLPVGIVKQFELTNKKYLIAVGCYSPKVRQKQFFICNSNKADLIDLLFLIRERFFGTPTEFKSACNAVGRYTSRFSKNNLVDYESIISQSPGFPTQGTTDVSEKDVIRKFHEFLHDTGLTGFRRPVAGAIEKSVPAEQSNKPIRRLKKEVRILLRLLSRTEKEHKFAFFLFLYTFLSSGEQESKPWFWLEHEKHWISQLNKALFIFMRSLVLYQDNLQDAIGRSLGIVKEMVEERQQKEENRLKKIRPKEEFIATI